MLKQFKDLSNVRTEVLFVQARLMHTITVLSSLIAAFAAGLLIFTVSSHDNKSIFTGLFAIAFMIFMAVTAHLQLINNILPELKKRCNELPSRFDKNDYTAEYKKQRKWGILANLFIALFILYIILQKIGFLQPNYQSGASLVLHLIVIIVLIIPGFIFMLLSIRCPACKRFIPRQFQNLQGTCPHCGAKLK